MESSGYVFSVCDLSVFLDLISPSLISNDLDQDCEQVLLEMPGCFIIIKKF